ncbi:hypothetical protein [Microbacterium kyungheense]|uniref:Metallo-beta-lactamase superfamily protein n=1 Tax=Microbacterium kyungheense TaxID=1263636 RepID=A0A543FJK9_9MICO|nr:hypothetical protein [Microbacterium kyungheense]TQM33995.1 hypothetical protein FB391_0282 [Microbacterium kyungheense]
MSTPVRVRVRMYQVGFGDCLLISVEYDEPLADGRAERHILVDYGTSHSPRKGFVRGRMADVAALIEQHTHGVLDVLVVTHRHRDHLRGFEVDAGAEILRRLAPKVVLRSWTENPGLAADAAGPADEPGLAAAPGGPAAAPAGPAAAPADGVVGPASIRYARLLGTAQEHAGALAGLAAHDKLVAAAADEQLKNADAVKLLDELSADRRGRYLYTGADAGIADLVPGLVTTVLGPPTPDQEPDVTRQAEDDDEYWLTALDASLALSTTIAAAEAGDAAEADADGYGDSVPVGPGPVRWLIDNLKAQRTHSLLRLVRNLDDALNNTSLLLLFEIGGLSLLFPGDAQIENWQHTLKRFAKEPELRAKLASVDLYKVGHHGSRNATPRTLWSLWKDRPDTLPRLTTLMSTRSGVHGKAVDTAVPQDNLVAALKEVSDLYSSDDDARADSTYLEVEAEVAQGGPFRLVPPTP